MGQLLPVPQPAAVGDGFGEIAPHGVDGVPGDVRCEHDVVESEQRVVRQYWFDAEHIQAGRGQPAVAKRADQGVFVDNRAA